jgi:hypothetical protein
VSLKFFEIEARFPRHPGEVPDTAVAYVAEQVAVPATRFPAYWEATRAVCSRDAARARWLGVNGDKH